MTDITQDVVRGRAWPSPGPTLPRIPAELRGWVDLTGLAKMAEDMVDNLPGGRFLVPHLLDGPYHLVVAEPQFFRPTPRAELLWASFIPVETGSYSSRWATEPSVRVDMFLLPHLVAQIVDVGWPTGGAGYVVTTNTTLDTLATAADLAEVVLQPLVATPVTCLDAACRAGFARALDTAGLRTTLTVLASLMPSVHDDNDGIGPTFEELLAATTAALT